MAIRVPVPDGSIVDLTFETEKRISPSSLHSAFDAAAKDPSYRGVLGVSEHELVSSDIIDRPESAIVDIPSIMTLDERRGKVLAWYDNEWGYACRVRDVVALVGGGLCARAGRSTSL
jgi:glyceraldehyde 3-phosphate dehydrogenase